MSFNKPKKKKKKFRKNSGIQKRYDQEKYYVFILKVTRLREKVPTYIFRTYK